MVAFVVAAAVLGVAVAAIAVRKAQNKRNANNHPLAGGVNRRIGMFERISNRVKLGMNKNRPDRIVEMPSPRNTSTTPGADEYVRA